MSQTINPGDIMECRSPNVNATVIVRSKPIGFDVIRDGVKVGEEPRVRVESLNTGQMFYVPPMSLMSVEPGNTPSTWGECVWTPEDLRGKEK